MNNDPSVIQNMTAFITKNSTRKSLHVGSQRFEYFSLATQERFLSNLPRSVKGKLDALLKNGYRLLVNVGNLDGITNHAGVQNVIKTLTWEHAEELIYGPRLVWKNKDDAAGYVTTTANNSSMFVMYRNAGHGVYIYQAKRCYQMVVQFIEDDT